MTPQERINNKEVRYRLYSRFDGTTGEEICILDGKQITFEEVRSLYPIDEPNTSGDKKKWKGENSDRTKNWMKGQKSY